MDWVTIGHPGLCTMQKRELDYFFIDFCLGVLFDVFPDVLVKSAECSVCLSKLIVNFGSKDMQLK